MTLPITFIAETGKKRGRPEKAERNRLIREKYAAGGTTYALLGAEFGISRQRVKDIIERGKK